MQNSRYIRGSQKDKVIIFVHGLFGDAHSTWLNQNGTYWPELITNDAEFNDYDVYVVSYQTTYFTRSASIEELSTRLLQQLKDQDVFKNHSQIYFVTHSMGGIIAKRMLAGLNRLNFSELQTLDRVRAIIYISTPAQGSTLAELTAWISLNPQLTNLQPVDLNGLLQAIENLWQHLFNDRNELGLMFPRSFCAYETRPTKGITIVSRLYATTSCDASPYPIDLDHIEISKPLSAGDDPYPWAKKRILELEGLGSERRIEKLLERLNQENGIEIAVGPTLELKPSSPPARVFALVSQVPADADPYLLALKAIAERCPIEARELLRKAQEVRDIELVKLYEAYGQIAIFEGHYSTALEWLEKARTLLPNDIVLKHETANAYAFAGQYQHAESLYKEVLRDGEEFFGKEHRTMAVCLNNFGALQLTMGNYELAARSQAESLKIQEKLLGKDHPDLAVNLNNLASIYQAQGLYDKALPIFKQALSMRLQTLGEDHPHVAISLSNMSALLRLQGHDKEAQNLAEKALTIRKKVFGLEHPDVARSLNNLSVIFHHQLEYDKAENLVRQALSIWEKILGHNHPEVAITLNNLASIYQARGMFDAAEPLYKESFLIRKNALGEKHPETARILTNLGSCYKAQGKYPKAIAVLEEAKAIQESLRDHPYLATTLNNLAGAYRTQGRYDDAEALFKRALTMREKIFGKDHPEVAAILGNLAGSYVDKGLLDTAETLLKQALKIQKKALGDEHHDVGLILFNLGSLYLKMGKHRESQSLPHAQEKYARAEAHFKEALAIHEKVFGQEHPQIVEPLKHYALALLKLNRKAEAEAFRERAAKIIARGQNES